MAASELHVKEEIDKREATTELKFEALRSEMRAMSSRPSGSSTPIAAHTTPNRRPNLNPFQSPVPRGSRSNDGERQGVVFVGGFLKNMPRTSIEKTLLEVAKIFSSDHPEHGVTSSWATAKFCESGRLQFLDDVHLWVCLKWWKQNGKEQNRFQYGSSFFQVWAAKEKSFGAKQIDRVTRQVAEISKNELHDVIDDPENLSVVHSRRKIFLSQLATENEPATVVCIAEAAWNNCLYTC